MAVAGLTLPVLYTARRLHDAAVAPIAEGIGAYLRVMGVPLAWYQVGYCVIVVWFAGVFSLAYTQVTMRSAWKRTRSAFPALRMSNKYHPRDIVEILTEISGDLHVSHGRPMPPAVVVVHYDYNPFPGESFFQQAERLGRWPQGANTRP
jgi:hypothetical protein